MVPRSILLAIVLVFIANPGRGQEKTKKAPAPADSEATVLFTNGSLVRMAVLQENFEVVTEFGKLTVPATQVRRIDFGIHYPEGVEEKIAAALKKLNSPQFQERDAALNELVALGPYAYPALCASVKGAGPELTQRIAHGVKLIRAKVPEKMLKVRHEDILVTPKFTIVGRIVTPKIKAKAEHFGDLQLAVSGLRSISWNHIGGDTEFVVDAAKYGGQGSQQWLDTGFTADGVSKLTIVASGQIDQWPQQPGQYMCGPRGLNNGMNLNMGGPGGGGVMRVNGKFVQVNGNYAPGALLGRFGEAGAVFVVGDRYEGTPEQEGKLYLQIVPSPWNCDSTGSFRVKVSSGFGD